MNRIQFPDLRFAPRVDRSLIMRKVLGGSPLTLPLLRVWSSYRSGELVDSTTDVCVEGFAFSANTFAYVSVLDSNPHLNVAHHTHALGQVIAAARRSIPTALLVREPLATLESLIVFDGNISRIGSTCSRWIDFHERLMPAIVEGKVVVCPFHRVTTNPAYTVLALNSSFGTNLAPPTTSVDQLSIRAQEMRNERGMPSRSSYEGDLEVSLDQVRAAIRDEPRASEAIELYQRVSSHAPAFDSTSPVQSAR